MKPISIIIPVFNDSKKLKQKSRILLKKIKKLKLKYEIIYVNDGSTDDSKKEIKNIIKKNKFIYLINNVTNFGKSFSIRRALRSSKYDHVILIDSDLPYFSKFETMIKLLHEKNDFVFIDRRHPKSKVKIEKFNFYIFLRFIIGHIISYIFKYIINLKNSKVDTQAGFKGFKKIKGINYYNYISERFFLDVELIYTYKSLNKKIKSVPVIYKISKSSSINLFNFNTNIKIFLELVKVLLNIFFKK